jgi:hypothetical protein
MDIRVVSWDGAKASTLRVALRLTVDGFASLVGGSPRAVARWGAAPAVVPNMAYQHQFDAILSAASPSERERFRLGLENLGHDHGRQ